MSKGRGLRGVPNAMCMAVLVAALACAAEGGQAQELTPSPQAPSPQSSSPQPPGVAISKSDAAKMPILPLNEQVLRLPGDRESPVDLEVTFYKPPGAGPFPLAIVNHGATHASDENRGERHRFTLAAY